MFTNRPFCNNCVLKPNVTKLILFVASLCHVKRAHGIYSHMFMNRFPEMLFAADYKFNLPRSMPVYVNVMH